MSKAPVLTQHLPNGQMYIKFRSGWKTIDANMPDDFSGMSEPCALLPNITAPKRKIGAANWYLRQLKRCLLHEAAALMFLEAYLTELRSTTFVLQALLHDVPGFNDWYEVKRSEMRNDSNLRWLVDARNVSQKIGLEFATWGWDFIVRLPKGEPAYVEPRSRAMALTQPARTVSISDLEQMQAYLEKLIDESHVLFWPNPPDRKLAMCIHYLRERADGTWEPFDVHAPVKRST